MNNARNNRRIAISVQRQRKHTSKTIEELLGYGVLCVFCAWSVPKFYREQRRSFAVSRRTRSRMKRDLGGQDWLQAVIFDCNCEEGVNKSSHQIQNPLLFVTPTPYTWQFVTILWSDYRRGFGLMIGFIEHLQNVTTNNYDSLIELHTPKITLIPAHKKSYQSSLAVAW
jgi:hypothetical protein